MSRTHHLLIESGPEQGRTLSVPAGGARIGRSSKNDISVGDPMLSRHHCRVYFKDDALCLADLGSVNETLVNGSPITDTRLNAGDVVLIGDTRMRVLCDRVAGPAAIDLGLNPVAPSAGSQPPRRLLVPLLIGVAVAVAALLAVLVAPSLLPRVKPPADVAPNLPVAEPARTLEIVFERVEATDTNIFRYYLTLDADGLLSVQIDDIANQSHAQKSTRVSPEYIASLRDTLDQSEFWELREEYSGRSPQHSVTDIALTIGRRHHRSAMRDFEDIEPPAFRAVRETIEEAAKNELQLHPILFNPARRVAMGQEAYLTAKKLYNERLVRPASLFSSIKQLENAMWYLETISPKPEFYPDLLESVQQYRSELQERYDHLRFEAERAMRSNEWTAARDVLQRIRALIPDASDERHERARNSLLEVERRIGAGK